MEKNERGTAMTTSNHARLAAESAEEREARPGGGGGGGQATVLQSEAQTTTGHAGTAPIVSTIFCPN